MLSQFDVPPDFEGPTQVNHDRHPGYCNGGIGNGRCQENVSLLFVATRMTVFVHCTDAIIYIHCRMQDGQIGDLTVDGSHCIVQLLQMPIRWAKYQEGLVLVFLVVHARDNGSNETQQILRQGFGIVVQIKVGIAAHESQKVLVLLVIIQHSYHIIQVEGLYLLMPCRKGLCRFQCDCVNGFASGNSLEIFCVSFVIKGGRHEYQTNGCLWINLHEFSCQCQY
mmetsp:Transcript_3628/g.7354  ORF Transcript_3628/g.7354 Transcript_3628/m.7354 type:complete len:223 (-) Transcript_3628:637-1305(-)